MNNDTIKAAEEFAFEAGDMRNNQKSFIAGAEYMQAQKDEQIKELVDGLKYARRFMTKEQFDLEYIDELIQKYKG